MTRTERALAGRWRWLATGCAIIALFGIAVLLWHRMDVADRRTNERAASLAAEADRRGEAVSTLADDVRALREQVKAKGETPVAPDPGKVIEDLPERAEVPVPVRGEKGEKGDPGKPAPTITPEDGEDGRDGRDGKPGKPAPSITPKDGRDGIDGKDGEDGEDGEDGRDGKDGARGQPGPPPASWTFTHDGTTYTCTPASDDSTHYTCEPDENDPPPDGPGPLAAALDPQRRQYA